MCYPEYFHPDAGPIVNYNKFSGIGPFRLRFREHYQAANLDILSNFAPLTIYTE